MAKIKSVYVCNQCGYESAKWYGRCPSCNEWNSMTEQVEAVEPSFSKANVSSTVTALKLNNINTENEPRFKTGVGELDRVLGGGIVRGSLILLGGDPGIGKSTMMLQICQYLGQRLSVLYVSGEESQCQIKLRAERLGVNTDNLSVMAATDAQAICEYIRANKPDIAIIDSIQTMSIPEMNSSPGSVPQVRESTNLFLRTAKNCDIPIFIIGHVNKDGAIAGPKVMEHIVDAVLYFEGDRNLSYRILRAVKNRFGSTNEIGVFEMQDIGLVEVENPSQMLLSGRPKNVPGTCVVATIEGSRPILAEVQGLATESGFGNPRRMSTGFDYNRFSLILAVLEKRAGYFFANLDSYINIVGGFRLDEPAVDLAVAMSLISSLKEKPVPEDVAVFGEIGLAGEIRAVSQAQQRVQEAARLGFTKCVVPATCLKQMQRVEGIEIFGVKSIRQAAAVIFDD